MSELLKELETLAPLAAAATEGPWRVEMDYESDTPMLLSGFGKVANVDDINFGNEFDDEEDALNEDQPEANAAFIAAARNFLTPANLSTLAAALSSTGEATAVMAGESAREMGSNEAAYFAHLSLLSPAALVSEWEATEEASHVEPESYKPEYVKLLLKALRVSTGEAKQEQPAQNPLVAFLLSSDTGVSSKAIAARYAGVASDRGYYGHPYDSADFGRCYRLLQLVPAIDIEVMRGASAVRDRLVDAWPTLTAAFENKADWKAFQALIQPLVYA